MVSKNQNSNNNRKRFYFVDVYAGCGGLSLGLMQAGWTGLFAIEHEENAFQSLHHNLIACDARFRFQWPSWLPESPHGVEEVLQNYSTQLQKLAGKIDMLVGGPPCQGFSSAGKRDPNDPRNALVKTYLQFVNLLKPKLVLIENVRGINSDFGGEQTNSGRVNYADWILAALSKHYSVSTKIIDLSDFGVPQKRHRFFIIGVRSDLLTNHALDPFDIIENTRHSFLRSKGVFTVPVSSKTAISDLEIGRNGTIPSRDSNGFEDISYVSPGTSYQKLMNNGSGTIPSDTRLARHRPHITERFTKLIKLCQATGRLNVSLDPELRASLGLQKKAIRVLDPDRPSPTITSMPDDLIHYSEPRTLTVRENARLQGFPDWFTFKGKYTTGGHRRRTEVPRFTQVANAVPPLAAEAVGIALLNYCSNRLSSRPSIALP